MSELQYDLKVEPPTIELEGPFAKKASTKIKMTNPGDHKVAIKMKTNNASFRISPSYAFVQPGKGLDVTVSCAGWASFNPDKNYNHRVVVQHAKVPQGYEETVPEGYTGTPKYFWSSNNEHRDITIPVKYGNRSATSPKSSKEPESPVSPKNTKESDPVASPKYSKQPDPAASPKYSKESDPAASPKYTKESDSAGSPKSVEAEQFHSPGVIKNLKDHQEILESGKSVIVMYGADWCTTCDDRDGETHCETVNVKPIFEKLGKEYKDSLQTYRLYDDIMDMEFRKRFSISDCDYPVIISFKDGERVQRVGPTFLRVFGQVEEQIEEVFKDLQRSETMSELEYEYDLVEVDTSTIELDGPFDKTVSTKIKMANPGGYRVAIKMKTNNAHFRISPSRAFIPPAKEGLEEEGLEWGLLDVTVSCAGWSSYNPDKTSYDHRVVVQAAKVPEGFEGTPTDFWDSNEPHRDITMPVKYGSSLQSAASPKSSKVNLDSESE